MSAPAEGLEWKFSQVFGDKSPIDEVTDGTHGLSSPKICTKTIWNPLRLSCVA
jgi:hypothetical protein